MRAPRSPEPFPDGTKVLHIGMPKTGTTSLQAAIHHARPEMEARGVHNVSPLQHELKVALRAAGTLPDYQGAVGVRRWPELAQQFKGSDARITWWSSEALSQARRDRLPYLADQLGSDLRIVVTLRPIVPLLVSQWQETLRRRGEEDLTSWLEKTFGAVAPDGEVRAAWDRVMPTLHRFSPARVVEEWGAEFGEENLVFVILDPRDRERSFRVIETLLGLPEILEQTELDNASLPYPEAEMLRNFNRSYTARGATHPDWMLAISELGRVPLREFAARGTPHRISAPRWAVEQSAAYTDRWIAALEASTATVIGEVDDLRTDPELHHETEVPRSVDVARAGELADILYAAGVEHAARRSRRQALESIDARDALAGVSGRQLVAELRRRVARRLGASASDK